MERPPAFMVRRVEAQRSTGTLEKCISPATAKIGSPSTASPAEDTESTAPSEGLLTAGMPGRGTALATGALMFTVRGPAGGCLCLPLLTQPEQGQL